MLQLLQLNYRLFLHLTTRLTRINFSQDTRVSGLLLPTGKPIWKVSIVDLFKLLYLDLSLAAPKTHAAEPDYSAQAMGYSVQMNT